MADEPTPADAPDAPETSPEAKSASAKAKKKPKRKPVKAALPPPKAPKAKPAKPATRPSGGSGIALVAVYIILGVLVIATSFYSGYLFGKNGLGGAGGAGAGTQTGSGSQEKLQIIEYSDYQCPFCGRVEPTIEQLKKDYGDKVEFVFKNFPLDSLHPFAHNAAIAAECARDQGDAMFWKYHDLLFQHQDALDVPQLKQYAQQLGLDTAKFNDCLDNKKTEARIQADIQEGQGRGVGGTPSFWIKDELFVGAQPIESFKAKIDEKLSGKAAPTPSPSPTVPAAPTGPVNVATGAHVLGDAKAKVTIVEFSDFQCPYCKTFYTATEGQIMDTYVKTGKAKFAFRNFPLQFHQNAQVAAEAAECVAKLGGNDAYWKFHDTLFTKGNGDGTGLDAASLKQYAKDQGIDATKFASCLDNHDTAAAIKADADAGSAAGVSGTPSFYINGVQLVGAQPFASFKTAIDAALAS